jgi:Coenzyme A transferase
MIALRFTRPLQRSLVNATGWWGLQDEHGKPVEGIELSRLRYQAQAWSAPRWVVGIRQHSAQRAEPKGKILNLLADDPVIGQWRYSALVTDMDLVSGVRRVVVLMEHTSKDGASKILKNCSLPLTGKGVVNLIITDLCVFEVETGKGLVLTELHPGVTLEDVKAKTAAAFRVAL